MLDISVECLLMLLLEYYYAGKNSPFSFHPAVYARLLEAVAHIPTIKYHVYENGQTSGFLLLEEWEDLVNLLPEERQSMGRRFITWIDHNTPYRRYKMEASEEIIKLWKFRRILSEAAEGEVSRYQSEALQMTTVISKALMADRDFTAEEHQLLARVKRMGAKSEIPPLRISFLSRSIQSEPFLGLIEDILRFSHEVYPEEEQLIQGLLTQGLQQSMQTTDITFSELETFPESQGVFSSDQVVGDEVPPKVGKADACTQTDCFTHTASLSLRILARQMAGYCFYVNYPTTKEENLITQFLCYHLG